MECVFWFRSHTHLPIILACSRLVDSRKLPLALSVCNPISNLHENAPTDYECISGNFPSTMQARMHCMKIFPCGVCVYVGCARQREIFHSHACITHTTALNKLLMNGNYNNSCADHAALLSATCITENTLKMHQIGCWPLSIAQCVRISTHITTTFPHFHFACASPSRRWRRQLLAKWYRFVAHSMHLHIPAYSIHAIIASVLCAIKEFITCEFSRLKGVNATLRPVSALCVCFSHFARLIFHWHN